jgi:predicted nucleotidyltransferase
MEADAFNELLESIRQAGAISRGELMPAQPPNRADVESRVAEAQPDIVALGVRRLALFGSVRRDAAGVGSDVDFLVEFAPGEKSYDHLLDLGDLLERILGHPVELVTPEFLSPYLRPHILADAVDVLRAA